MLPARNELDPDRQTPEWTRLCAIAEIPDGGAIDALLHGQELVLVRYGAQVYGYLNVCPHAGRPLNWAPGKFLLAHGQLVCASHGAAFKVETGECIGGPCRGQSLGLIATELRGEEVFAR
jgi:nitrite reductase/ring-hydroxylating ferredoxin subunit